MDTDMGSALDPAPSSVPTVAPPRVKWLEEYGLLLRLQYTDYRGNAPFLMIFGLIMPLGVFWLLQTYVGGGPGSAWLLAGNLVMSVCYGAVSFAIQRTAWMKLAGEMDYYGTLPIRKSTFVLVIFTLGLISALPGLISGLLIGYFALDLQPQALAWAIPLSLLAAASLTVLGAMLGSMIKSMPQLNVYFYVTYLVVTFLSPVLVPLAKLPLPLQVTSYILPTGQAALAITEALSGRFELRFWLLTGALFAWLLFALIFGVRRLDWRKD